MQCPLCLDAPLEPKYIGATEVDICPTCRGIWLDRGELDRLLGEGRRSDDRLEQRSDGSRFEDRRPEPRHDDRPKKPKGKKSKAKRLADLFEEVLDL